MGLIDDLYKAVSSGLEPFKQLVQQHKEANNSFLEQFFWTQAAEQMTLLNFLIQKCQSDQQKNTDSNAENNYFALIDYVLNNSLDINVGEPLHQAIRLNQLDLVLHLLGGNRSFDVNKRDCFGQALLYLALNTKNINLLKALLTKKPNLHAPTFFSELQCFCQPLHQAVFLDFSEGVRLLVIQGAELANPVGVEGDTPLTLAAKHIKINALEALLEFPPKLLAMEKENKYSHVFEGEGCTALEELCEHLLNNKQKMKVIRGIAMLLCCGAEPPKCEKMRNLLCQNRHVLMKVIQIYLKEKPDLVDAFVHRCHLSDNPLHLIFYANQSWDSSIRHLFAVPNEVAFMIEDLVVKKRVNKEVVSSQEPMPSKAEGALANKPDALKWFAEFVRRYQEAYNSQTITNPWSSMRWKIMKGECDWEFVIRYAKSHPTSRTAIVYRDMMTPLPTLHDKIEEAPVQQSI